MARTPKDTPVLFPKAADVAFDRICNGFQTALDEADNIRRETVSLTQAQHDILHKNAMALEATYNTLKTSYGRADMDTSSHQTRCNDLRGRWATHELLHDKERDFLEAAKALTTLLEQPDLSDKLTNPQFIRDLNDAERLVTDHHKSLNKTLITAPYYSTYWRDKYDELQERVLPVLRKFEPTETKAQTTSNTEAGTLRNEFGQAHIAIFDLAMNIRKRDLDRPYMLPNDIPATIDALEEQLDKSMSALQEAYQGRTQFLETEAFTYQGAKDTLEQIRDMEGLNL